MDPTIKYELTEEHEGKTIEELWSKNYRKSLFKNCKQNQILSEYVIAMH